MKLTTNARDTILRRLAEIEPQLSQVEADLKELRHHDPRTSEVVIKGAALFREKVGLEKRLARDGV